MATLKDIARSIAGSNNLKGNDAEAFITAIVDTILEGLEQDRIVKIKGFGTFKLTSVRDRESVNVNTGERVMITGHDKISFTPENAVRDLINKPFVHFETVVLSESISQDDMDVDGDEESQPANEENVPQPVEPQVEPETELVSVPVVETVKPDPVEEVEEPAPVEEPEIPVPFPVEEAEVPAPMEESEEPAPVEETPAPADDEATTHVDLSEYLDDEDKEESGGSCKTVFILYAVIANILISIAAFVAGYICCQHDVFSLNKVEDTEIVAKETAPVAKKSEAAVKKTETPADTVAKQKPAEVESPKAKVEEKTPEPVNVKADASIPDQTKYNADARIRTGAYYIIGIERTVIAKEGQTLKSISRTHLGPDMECYVEAVNEKKEVVAGDKVKIPQLKLKKLKRQ